MRKILLDAVKGKLSVNNDKGIPVVFNRDSNMLNEELLTTTIDTMNVYNEEKDKSTKHRLVLTVYPLCSNVLFNRITEIVQYEGSDKAKMLLNDSNNGVVLSNAISGEALNRVQAIRNTEYSNKTFEMSYHCGVDIFNNHLLRAKGDVCIQKKVGKKGCNVTGDTQMQTDTFNTIADYSRDTEGEYIEVAYPVRTESYTYNRMLAGPEQVYHYDTIKSFKEAYNDSLKRQEGWVGFTNPSTMHIPSVIGNRTGYYINKCINSKKACEFIHLSPEKELFSFTPIRNTYRNRLEYNWDYFITYPAYSVSEGFENGLPLNFFLTENVVGGTQKKYKEYKGSNGLDYIMFYSPVDHNLTDRDNVYICFEDGKRMKCGVKKTGDFNGKNKSKYFSILKDDLKDPENDELYQSEPISFIRVSNGYECQYYYRVFRKIPDLKSSINKLAFAGTVYGDDVTQIVFTDDVDIAGLKDNRGRDLTEIYFTVLKSNRGHSEWYDYNNASSSNVEFSHVFGKVTSGLDLPYDNKASEAVLPLVRQQHNVDISSLPNEDENVVTVEPSAKYLEEDITRDMEEFFGDLVEFDPGKLVEKTLAPVKHRFNTAQRETSNPQYGKLYHDDVMADGYDSAYYGVNSPTYKTSIRQTAINEGFANIDPEGYIYTPHHRIKIGEFDTQVKHLSDTLMEVSDAKLTEVDIPGMMTSERGVSFRTTKGYGINTYDRIVLIDKNTYKPLELVIMSYIPDQGGYVGMAVRADGEDMTDNAWANKSYVYKHNPNIPDYAYLIPDGTGKYIWREKIANSAVSFTSDLYDTPFTNGAFYHHSTVIFPVRRQDPFGGFQLSVHKNGSVLEENFKVPSVKEDIETDIYIDDNSNGLCL